jgi:hypothetical protein
MGGLLAELPERLTKMLAGEDLSKDALARYQQHLRADEEMIDKVFQDKMPKTTVQQKLAETAPRSAPKTLKLKPLWKAADLKSPGNILVVPGEGTPPGPPRIFVIDELKSIVELGPDGHTLATHRPEPQTELICNLRTATGGDGHRIYAAFGLGGHQLFCFDAAWKQILAYPDAAIKANHKGIADVMLGDAEGTGVLRAYVGFYDATGIQAVSLEGKRLWSNRELWSVMRTALAPADDKGRRNLLCAYQGESGALGVLDAAGKRQGDVSVPGWPIIAIVPGDLRGDGRPLWAALSANAEGQCVLGINLQGEVLWNYPLPKGLPRQPIEPIIAGRITPDGPGQWLLPGCDGSVHVLSADGKQIDRFNYGAILGGLATVTLGGKPVLLISSENGLEALGIE